MMNSKKVFIYTALVFLSNLVIYAQQKKVPKEQKPNVIVIIADDAGWNDVGYNGSEIKTPNIDNLAKNGVQLNRFYVSPTCSPTRAALLTGRPASRMGILAPISDKSELKLPDSIPTLPQLLKKNGYETALIGKWHLGLQLNSSPKAYGFDYSYGFLHGQIDQYTHRYKNGDQSWYRNGEFIDEKGHTTDLVTQESIKWLSEIRNKKENFYLQVAYSAPHFPLQEEEKWKIPYNKTAKDSSRRDYDAAMAHLDHSIGILLDNLKKQKLDENTLIIFMSDNGAMENWDSRKEYGGIHRSNTTLGDNTPLRDWKTSNYEGAVRVPCVLYWKGRLKNYKNSDYISVIDFLPTILGLAGAEKLPKTVEGQNIWNEVSANKEIKKRPIYIRGHKQACLIQKPWKLIQNLPSRKGMPDYELFNIEKDPEEKNNVLPLNQEIFGKMKQELDVQIKKDPKIAETNKSE
ncbi:sulfatase [Flavobacterium sp. HJJ]|uniref:sulfatase family protein n=1 Tax=Flavobacterium sp. HJJ TaxID=2783792 RepID=UPI00188B1CDD|nr:sulfatase-like hydrolase/transferase [Flavobacterium sp. HJJ]MBF4471414.1 sulfatase-like hydrolase/transferase [Flavobacterium sp. HJJ]